MLLYEEIIRFLYVFSLQQSAYVMEKSKKEYLGSFKIISLYQKRGKDSVIEVARCLLLPKYKFDVEYINAQITRY